MVSVNYDGYSTNVYYYSLKILWLYLDESYVSVPNVAIRRVLPAGIQSNNLLRLFGAGIDRMDVMLSEILGEIALLFWRQRLPGKEYDLMGEKGLVYFLHRNVVENIARSSLRRR